LFSIVNGPGPFHPAIACESAPTSLLVIAVNVRAIEDDVMWKIHQICMSIAELDEVVQKLAVSRRDFDTLEPIMMRAGIADDGGFR
jgi:hypothetical protein